MIEPDGTHMIVWRMRSACRIPKATGTHSGYVIIIDYARKQRFNECASVLRDSTLPNLLKFQIGCVTMREFNICDSEHHAL